MNCEPPDGFWIECFPLIIFDSLFVALIACIVDEVVAFDLVRVLLLLSMLWLLLPTMAPFVATTD